MKTKKFQSLLTDEKRLIEVAKKAISIWGEDSQIRHLHEEVGELIVAINHFKRGRVSKEAVQEEIADVILMAYEMAVIFGDKGVRKQLKSKLRIFEKRIQQYKKNPTAFKP